MELKRILASDTRSANEMALKLYGPDVFVISNQRLAGQTELVVAVDVQAPAPQEDTSPVTEQPSASESFTDQLQAAQKNLVSPVTKAAAIDEPVALSQQNDRDLIRSREIVDAIRDEIATLRKEFRLSQKAQLWQSTPDWAPEVQPLVQGLYEASVPTSLRTLLLDGLRGEMHLSAALDQVVQQLVGNITAKAATTPEHGVHVLVGPSGAGKTTMMARLARRALKTISTPEIAMISFRDHRAGAWGQLQMLCSQLGIDCYRAQDAQALATLLNELSPRRLILIDTPGVQMSDRLAECRQVCPSAQIHAVVPADVSTASLHRIMAAHNVNLQSLMISKLDESSAPWPLLQHLMTSPEPIGLSVGSESDRLEDELLPLNPSVLAELAVSQWLPAQHVPKPAMPAHSALITEFH